MDKKNNHEKVWLSKWPSEVWEHIDMDSRKYTDGYASVTRVNVLPVRDANNKDTLHLSDSCYVILGLRRISDGLESTFETIQDVATMNKFADAAQVNENIAYLKGKVINVVYFNHVPVEIGVRN